MSPTNLDLIGSEVQRRADWAARHVEALTNSVAAWGRESHVARLGGALSPDRRSIDLRLEGIPPAPVEEWGFLIGDALHNMRSLLNNLLHSIAVASAGPGGDVGRLQFPISETERDWTRANGGGRKQIKGLPESVVRSVESLQPFNRGGSDSVAHVLWLLNDLSNADKHRVATLPAHSTNRLDLTVSAELLEPGLAPIDGEVVFANSSDVLAHVEFGQPVRSVKIDARVTFAVFIFDSRGRHFEAGPLTEKLLQEVVGVANTVLTDWNEPTSVVP